MERFVIVVFLITTSILSLLSYVYSPDYIITIVSVGRSWIYYILNKNRKTDPNKFSVTLIIARFLIYLVSISSRCTFK
jgi:hypothetical protein